MTAATSVLGALDAISAKAKGMTVGGKPALGECYTATGSGVSGAGRPIPPILESGGPVGVVWIGDGALEAGNAEVLLFRPTLDIWVPSADIGAAYRALAAFPDILQVAFRDDLTLGGMVDRCLLTGWRSIASGSPDSAPMMYLPFTLECLILNFMGDAYTV